MQGNNISGANDGFEDKIVMYCSYFTYAPDGAVKRQEIMSVKIRDIVVKMHALEQQKLISSGTTETL